MRKDIIDFLQGEVKRRCELPTNFFDIGCYYHIQAVVKNAEMLAKQFGADVEIVIIAAWLHDIASITDYALYEEHHIHGADIANEILQDFSYEESRIKSVQDCILNHRGSVISNRLSREALCVADADAISHFDNIPSLLYLAYVNRGLDMESGTDFVKGKLKRSYDKLSTESKEFYKHKYKKVMDILDMDGVNGL